MSEASHEEGKEKQRQVYERALHARYHLIKGEFGLESFYGVITFESQCEIRDQEYVIYQFVSGLERLPLDEAIKVVQILNRDNPLTSSPPE